MNIEEGKDGTELSLNKEVDRLKQSLSKHKREQEFVKTWESLFYVLLKNLPDTIYFKDTKSRFILINRAQAQVLGVSDPADAHGKTDFDFFTEEHAHSAYEDEQRMIKDGLSVINKRERIRRADGQFRWVLATKVPIKDEDGKITGIAGMSRDITEQVQAEEIIKTSEQKFRSVWENSLDGMRLIDSEGRIVSVNNAYCKMVGKTTGELIGQHYATVYKSEFQDSIKKKTSDRLAARTIEPHFERNVELWDGRSVWFEVSNSYIESDVGQVMLLSIFRDITGRKDLIERLKMFEDTIKSVNDSITITDLSDRLVFVNRAFCKMYGYKAEEVIGKPVSILWSDTNPPGELAKILPGTLQGGWKGEVINKRKDGEEFPVSLSTSVIKNDANEPIALIGVANDISVQKRMEEQMRQAQKLQGIGELVGGISHHFNNILNIIVGYTSLLESDDIDKKKLKNFLGVISDAAERGTNLVHQLTIFIKKSPMRQKNIDIVDTVKKVVAITEETFPASISFSTQFDVDQAAIHADPEHIRQCILNILFNARDAMKDGGKVYVRMTTMSGDTLTEKFLKASKAEYVCIEITDTGTGMDEKTKSRIFEPFFTTKEYGMGIGLGLPTVYGIVESAGGFIDVQSTHGKGTSVFLYFPAIATGE